jgi:SAM-dependent methyltransferase
MTTPAINPTSAEGWRGERGVAWLKALDGYETMLRPLGEALLERAALSPGQSVVDIGCGGGWTSRKAAREVGANGHVCGVDIAPMLIEEAARRAEGTANISFHCADASAEPLPALPFDRMISRLGVMFFTEAPLAVSRLRALLKQGGQLDWAVWAPPAHNPWMGGVRPIVERHIDLPPMDPDAPGPFSLADTDKLQSLLTQAGFTAIDIVEWCGGIAPGGHHDPERAADFALTSFSFGPPFDNASPATKDKVRGDLVAFFESFLVDGQLAIPAKAWLVRATAS